jgi:DNA-binding transcriptional MocR family regulator
MREAADAVLQNKDIAVPAMLYAPDEGDLRLREELGKWLSDFNSEHIKEPVDASRLAITGGASQNLACVLQTFTDPEYTRNIWIVAPSYFLAFRIFNDSGFGAKLRAVPEDEEGLDIEYLREQIHASEKSATANGNSKPKYKVPTPWGKVYKHIIYAVPTFSNPSSKTMSLRRRQALVRLAREYDALIVTDDVYDQLQWPASNDAGSAASLHKSAIPRIVDVDRYLDGGTDSDGADGFGNACSNASFSKIMGPGTRTGWCEGTPKLAYGVSQTGTSRSGGAPSQLAGTFLAEALAQGRLQKHVYEVLQPAYARRWHVTMNAVQKNLVPLGVKLPQEHREIVGGYFLWLRLPPHIRANLLARRCKDTHNLIIADGTIFEVPGDAHLDVWGGAEKGRSSAPRSTAFPYDIRLCFAWEEEEALVEGVERLASVIKSMLEEPEGLNPTATRRSFEQSVRGDVDISSFQ